MNLKKNILSQNIIKFLLLNSILVVSSFADIKPVIQTGLDLILMQKPSKTIEVNHGYVIEGGFEYTNETIKNFSTQFLVGYKKVSLTQILKNKKNVPIDVTSKFVSIIEKYNDDNMNYGLGVTYHISPEADYTYNNHVTREFDNAFGLLGQIGYSFTENIDFGIKATAIKYKIEVKRKNKIHKREYNTSSLNIFVSYKF